MGDKTADESVDRKLQICTLPVSRVGGAVEFTQPHSRIATADSARCISLRGCVENRTVQRGCADSTVATVATHPVGEGGKRQRRLACYVHTVATA